VRFEVLASWKGAVSDTLSLMTGTGGGDCGFPFTVSRTYLVYGIRTKDSVLSASICSRTRRVESAREDSIALGRPEFDRLGSQSWTSLGPPTKCPLHGSPLFDGAWWYAADLTPDARRKYPEWLKREAPFAGMPPMPPTLSGGKVSTLVGYATMCPMCREAALEWIGTSQEASSAPETWDLPVRVGKKTPGYRLQFPRAQFAIQYGDGRQQFDSIESTFVRAFGSVRDTTVKLALSEVAMDSLYEGTVTAGLMDLSAPHPAYPRERALAVVRTDRPCVLYVRCGIEVRQFTWYEARAPRDPDPNSEWGRLVRLYRDVQRRLTSTAALRALPPLPSVLDDPLRLAARNSFRNE